MRIPFRTKPWHARVWAATTIAGPIAWHLLAGVAANGETLSVLSRGRL